MSKRIYDSKPSKNSGSIREGLKESISDSSVHFSFKYLDINNQKFSINGKKSKYFEKMLERLKGICLMTQKEIINNRSKSLRAHQINWSDTTEPRGFSQLNQQLQQILPYQFEISANEHGRVHGFFIDNIFFIVWFDPDYKLYN